jgi:FMN-dependent NADH-azoreductase
MNKLLKITSSTRGADSYSNQLADAFETKWKNQNSKGEVMVRDLTQTTLPHVTQAFIEAMYTPLESRDERVHEILALSDELISELREVDTIVLALPMYNFGVPSVVKAYIDQISRVGETFSMDENGFTGLLTGKKLVICSAYGADFIEMRSMDFVEPYLKSLFRFLGFTDISYFALEGTTMFSSEELEKKQALFVEQF